MTIAEVYFKNNKVNSYTLKTETLVCCNKELITYHKVCWYTDTGWNSFEITKEEYDYLLQELKNKCIENSDCYEDKEDKNNV